MTGNQTLDRAAELAGARVPFVRATVVRAQAPASARPGDQAIVLSDGSMEGFVGGQCTQNSVRTAALTALADGAAVLLRVLPDGMAEFPSTPGAQVVVNPCLSGGSVEIFLEPVLPPPVVAVLGGTPIAEAVRSAVTFLGYTGVPVTVSPDGTGAGAVAGSAAVVVASHGPGEPETIRAALDAQVPYIALVASRRRGTAVLDEMGLTDAERARVHSPAGLWIGARTAPEIALSIMAEVVAVVRGATDDRGRDLSPAAPAGPSPADAPAMSTGSAQLPGAPPPVLQPLQAIDPVCGMTVTVMPDTPTLRIDGQDFYFCNPGCRTH
ncbi:MAG TPA: XdhC family protein, partial [Nakamurella sp.]|nr:XdhC family protein [Nakamurella sp.]